MKIAIPLIFLALILFPAALSQAQNSAADSLTVEAAVRLTLENYPLIHQAELGEAVADARVNTSRSSYYPDISATGALIRVGPIPSMEVPHQQPINLYPDLSGDLHLGLRQTIYDFGKTAMAVKMAESGRASASAYLSLVKANLAYQTIAIFNAILILHRNISVLDEQIAALGQHLEVSAKRVQTGTATDFDVLTTQVRIAVANNERIDAYSTLENQEIIFRQLTGVPSGQPINLKGVFSNNSITLKRDSLLIAAEDQRWELALARDAEKSSEIQYQLMSLGDKPSLALSLTSGLKNGYYPDLNTYKVNYTAGVLLQIPIFNGHRTRYQKLEAETNLRSSRVHTEDIQRQVISEVDQAIASVNSSQEKIQNSEIQVRQAEEALSMANTRYEAGVITNLDLLDAQTTLSQAKLIRLRALYNYAVSLNALNKATGRQVW